MPTFPLPTSGIVPHYIPPGEGESVEHVDFHYQMHDKLNAVADLVADFGADPTGSGVCDSRFAEAFDQADIVQIPRGARCRTTAPVEVPEGKTLQMAGITADASTPASASILKDGDFDGVILHDAAVIRDAHIDGDGGNGGDGVYAIGQRTVIENVSVTNHGQDGARFGGKTTGQNSNLPRVYNLIALSNGRHGVYAHDVKSTTSPDANTGLLCGFDARGNGGDGFKAESSIDWQIIGYHAASNGGYGFHGATGCEGYYLWGPYVEANTAGELILDAGSIANVIWGVRSNLVNDPYVDNGTNNLILGRNSESGAQYMIKSLLEFAKLGINNTAISGQWQLRQNPTTRALEIALVNTSADGVDIALVHDGGQDLRLVHTATAGGEQVQRCLVTGDTNTRWQDVGDGRRLYGPGNAATDTEFGRKAAGVAGVALTQCLKTGAGVTASRPSASTVTAGAFWFDTTLGKPIWSDGTNWRDAAGTVV